jgi:hypothetical protein
MSKTKTGLLVSATLASLVLVAAVEAGREDAKPPVGSCPTGYSAIEASIPPIGPVVDLNKDGVVCYRIFNGPAEEKLFANVIDNTAAPH